MPTTFASAPGKTILFGEHAVVYGYPAIAVPVNEIQAKVKIFPVIGSEPNQIQFVAPQIEFDQFYGDMEVQHPLRIALDAVKNHLEISHYPACKIHISSTIPIASGLGSSAAISVAVIKAMLQFVGFQPTSPLLSQLAYKVEVEFHGTPSGIDNTVIAYQRPLFYRKDKEIEFISTRGSFTIIIADSGLKGNTKIAVSQVRERWQNNPVQFDHYFQEIGKIATDARIALENGDQPGLGKLMHANQFLLQKIGVSHPALESLISVANESGALGAKLCGAGLGGNIIVLSQNEEATFIAEKLANHGAVKTIIMKLQDDKRNE